MVCYSESYNEKKRSTRFILTTAMGAFIEGSSTSDLGSIDYEHLLIKAAGPDGHLVAWDLWVLVHINECTYSRVTLRPCTLKLSILECVSCTIPYCSSYVLWLLITGHRVIWNKDPLLTDVRSFPHEK